MKKIILKNQEEKHILFEKILREGNLDVDNVIID